MESGSVTRVPVDAGGGIVPGPVVGDLQMLTLYSHLCRNFMLTGALSLYGTL